METLRCSENWAAPFVIVGALVLLVWIAVRAGDFDPLLGRPFDVGLVRGRSSSAGPSLELNACAPGVTSGLSLRRSADTNKDNPERQVRLSFLG
ncbi:hypothetical protein ACIQMR_18985 [Streptomyces sp. NPDC091376]|uniref:hypothetical protein n=1 Tax=Streptomyces sp. NPDC091376 TaxID=3365994 RepID=UPI0038047FF2